MKRFNADVARVIARGHGYKDQQYLFLKLRQIAKKINESSPLPRGRTFYCQIGCYDFLTLLSGLGKLFFHC
jgi:hypothetical protein